MTIFTTKRDCNSSIRLKRHIGFVFNGKGSKDRVVYRSGDTGTALDEYLKKRGAPKVKRMFLVQKGPMKGKPISVRGRSEEHTSELQSHLNLVCRLLL